MTDSIKPALTAEEWEIGYYETDEGLSVEQRAEDGARFIYIADEIPGPPGEEQCTSDASAQLTDAECHAVAAPQREERQGSVSEQRLVTLHGGPEMTEWARVSDAERLALRTAYREAKERLLIAQSECRIARDALRGAGRSREPRGPRYSREVLIRQLQVLAKRIGRTPSAADIDSSHDVADSRTLRRRFGSLRNAQTAAGLSPNKKGRRCLGPDGRPFDFDY